MLLTPAAERRAPLRHALVLLTLAACGLAATEASFSAVAAAENAVLTALFPVVGGGFVVVGSYAWLRRPANRTGPLLCVTGLLILAAALADVGGPRPLTGVGVLLAETPIAATLHVVLAFPSGRARRWDARWVVTLYVLVLVRQAPLVVPGSDLQPLRTTCSLLGAAVLLVCAVRLVRRVRQVRREDRGVAERRVLAVVYGYGMLLLLFFPFSARVLQPLLHIDIGTVTAVQVAGLAVLPAVFATGVLAGGFGWTRDLSELSSWLGAEAQDQAALRDVLAQVLGDPSLAVLFTPATHGPVTDASAGPVDPRRGAVRVRGADGHDAGVTLTYDRTLFGDPEPVEQAGRVVAVALERERLRADLLVEREALRASRARVIEEGDLQRRRLAGDLHDVLQSRLTLAAMHAGRLAAATDEDLQLQLTELRDQLAGLTTEVRHLVHGVMPALLLERGLPAAVEDLVDRLPLPTRLELVGAERPPPAIATNSYFILAEALTNAVRHARAATLTVRVVQQVDAVHLVVRDDGVGGVRLGGATLRSIAERVEALDGRLRVDSPVGVGTTVEVVLPCAR